MSFKTCLAIAQEYTTLNKDRLPSNIIGLFKETPALRFIRSGLGMERLWHVFRPKTLPGLDRLKSITILEEQADLFDTSGTSLQRSQI